MALAVPTPRFVPWQFRWNTTTVLDPTPPEPPEISTRVTLQAVNRAATV